MPLTLEWKDIAVRLLLTVLAGGLIGWNRGEHGHPAGLRTTILVCLAASLSMIEANLLLDTRGKPGDSFAVLDLARFPLGVLSGMGFIGAGAILRRGHAVEGVTTAATLWFVTMVGLCMGGGQIGLGIAGTAIGYVVLSLLKLVEDSLGVERRATVTLTTGNGSGISEALTARLSERGYRLRLHAVSSENADPRRAYRYEVRWRAKADDAGPTDILEEFTKRDGIVALRWRIGAP